MSRIFSVNRLNLFTDRTKRMVHEPVAQKNREQNFRKCLIRSAPDHLEGILCIVVLLSHIVILFV